MIALAGDLNREANEPGSRETGLDKLSPAEWTALESLLRVLEVRPYVPSFATGV